MGRGGTGRERHVGRKGKVVTGEHRVEERG